MDPKSLAGEIITAGADKVLEKNPKRVDDAVVNTVIKQGANALESGVSKGNVNPAVGAAAEVHTSNVSHACTCTSKCNRYCDPCSVWVVHLNFLCHTNRYLNVKASVKSSVLAAICIGAHACHHSSQGVRHSKPSEVVEEVKAQLKEKVQPAGNPLADVIVAAGMDKLSKKPEHKQTDLIGKRLLEGEGWGGTSTFELQPVTCCMMDNVTTMI